MDLDGADRSVVVSVRATDEPEHSGFFLVIFDELDAAPADETAPPSDATVREIESELETTRDRLDSIIEEYEAGRRR